MLWGLSSGWTSAAWKPVSYSLLHRAETWASIWAAHTAGCLEAQPIRYITHVRGMTCSMKLLLQQWRPLLDERHGLTTVTELLGAPGSSPAHSNVSFPQSTGLERVSLAATVPSQANACQTEDKPSQKFTKHCSLVNWTVLTPDDCSWNLFSKKQKLSSFKRWCSLHAESCANMPLELQKTIPSLLMKSEKMPYLFST